MRNWIFSFNVVVCAAICAGCSFPEQFFLINTSPAPIVVVAAADAYFTYTGARRCSWADQGTHSLPLFAVPAASLGSDHVPFSQMSPLNGVTVDDTTCALRATVEPGVAVLLWETSNGRRYPFLSGLVLDSGRDIVNGPDVARRFRKRSSDVYVFEYRPHL